MVMVTGMVVICKGGSYSVPPSIIVVSARPINSGLQAARTIIDVGIEYSTYLWQVQFFFEVNSNICEPRLLFT